MNIQTTQQGDIAVIQVAGRIDPTTSPQLEEALNAALPAAHYRVVMDLTGVDFISSHGLRVFLTVLKKVKSFQGDVKLCGLGSEIEKVFRISGFVSLFDITATADEAVRKFSG